MEARAAVAKVVVERAAATEVAATVEAVKGAAARAVEARAAVAKVVVDRAAATEVAATAEAVKGAAAMVVVARAAAAMDRAARLRRRPRRPYYQRRSCRRRICRSAA